MLLCCMKCSSSIFLDLVSPSILSWRMFMLCVRCLFCSAAWGGGDGGGGGEGGGSGE